MRILNLGKLILFQIINDDFKIVVFTLAVHEITDRHTGETFTEMIERELEKYGISIEDLYSVTTDSGSNMVKMIKLLNELYYELRSGLEAEESVEDDDTMDELMEQIAHEISQYDHIIGG